MTLSRRSFPVNYAISTNITRSRSFLLHNADHFQRHSKTLPNTRQPQCAQCGRRAHLKVWSTENTHIIVLVTISAMVTRTASDTRNVSWPSHLSNKAAGKEDSYIVQSHRGWQTRKIVGTRWLIVSTWSYIVTLLTSWAKQILESCTSNIWLCARLQWVSLHIPANLFNI